MRFLILALGAVSLMAQDVAALTWVAGHWVGSMGRARIEENWLAPAGGAMLGVSRTVVGERMVGFEFLRIETRKDGVYYVAQPGGKPPTAFKLTKASDGLAVFENPQHDHPKVITYRLESKTLVATIEGDEGGQHKKQEFRFERASR
jgi:hypothetical protein